MSLWDTPIRPLTKEENDALEVLSDPWFRVAMAAYLDTPEGREALRQAVEKDTPFGRLRCLR